MEVQVETPRRLHVQEESQVSVDILQVKEGDGDQPETWKQAGRPQKPKCLICGRTCTTSNAMEKHMKDHEQDLDDASDDSSFNRRKCHFQSETRINLVEHLKIKHGLYTCSSCNVTFESNNELDTHIA